MGDQALPFGMRDTHITPYTDAAGTTLGTSVDSPNAQSLSFSEAEDYEELRGDDKIVAVHGKGPKVDWDMESGGISLAAYKSMNGGTVTTTGITPSTVSTYNKKVTDIRPYFKAEGQAISDLGGDFHAILYKSIADGGIKGEMSDGNFWITKASGSSIASTQVATLDFLYDFILNETAVAPV